MTITSYSTLVDAIGDRMNSDLSAYADEFIQMAEAMFNRRIFNLEGEVTATIAAAASITLPTDFVALKSLWLEKDPRTKLTQVSEDVINAAHPEQTTGEPIHYALASDEIILRPAPDSSYTVKMTYVGSLTGLSSTNATNWLIQKHPDLYLYASLLHAEFRGWNDDRLPMIGDAVENIIAEINQAGNMRRTSGTMRMRASVVV